jgi:NADPH2:quinone reductase
MGERVVISELGDDPLTALESFASLQPMQPPDPATLNPTDVVIAIKSASVGWVDLLMTSGQYQHIPSPPYTPGLEYAGTIHHAPPNTFARGEPVLVDPFLAGPRSHGSYRDYGGFASYAVAPLDAIHRIPGRLTFDQACNLLGNYETAYHCLITRGRLTSGETVLINGASGATGLAAVHIAKLLGATVIATGRSPAKLEIVRAQGADHTLVPTPTLRDDVKALTSGRGVDVVYDGVGGELSLETLRCLRFGGRFLIVGWASTPAVARGKGQRGAPNANTLPTNIIMMKGIDVLGCPTAISTVNDPSLRPPRLAQILAWAADGKLTPHISHVFPLADFKQAMLAKWRGEVIGGAVLHPPI